MRQPHALNGLAPFHVFHVTHYNRIESILKKGLLVKFNRTGKGRTWFCTVSRLPWAIRHVADTHGWFPADLIVLGYVRSALSLFRIRRGILCTSQDVEIVPTLIVDVPEAMRLRRLYQ